MNRIKNIAIIAHVDHGKTTLVDCILRQAGVFKSHQKVEERVMDSNDLERERGITIFSKNAAYTYRGYKVNIVDTPGHADFGSEVQRILSMVDSVLLVVDAFEGTMPQTKYVLKKSLELGLMPIVIINKIDRLNSEPDEVLNQVFDLFVELNAADHQLDFPVIYASGRDGYAKLHLKDESKDMIPLLDMIIDHVANTSGDRTKPFQFLTSAISYDNYIGKIGTGKIHNGSVRTGDNVTLIKKDGKFENYRITKILTYEGINRVELKEAFAGDIVSLAGMDSIDVGETVTDPEHRDDLPSIDIDKPTVAMTFMVNNSPFAGREGKFVTSRNIWDRLMKELQTNVGIIVEATDSPDSFLVKGRGELQLSILIENMRREGFELQVSKPQVIFRQIDGEKCEPIEHAIIDVDAAFVGVVMEKLGIRKGELINMVPGKDGYTRLEFHVPTRGLLGFRNEFMTETRGTGILNHSFHDYGPYKGDVPTRNKGVLIVLEDGVSVAYSLDKLKDRGAFFIAPVTEVYAGMIAGENSRESDMIINVCKGKKLTNMRASGTDDAINLEPPRKFSLEQAMEYIADDELLEITPVNIRMRKKILDPTKRKRTEIAAGND
ncbi:MAG: translational GTPase TypA [Candidatus Goldiibacteriota bacterium HGW-Goldbacteria-1]|jgi:GTP-binding protein|nr:MAG: translational GTPase TypA [Candidatus Goldiibacteriota bacterium HGW-Goldbacteria-1]